jgi:hypothetical protein
MMDVLSENAVSQGMVLASLIGGIALASIAQLVSAFPNRGEQTDGGKSKDVVTAAITWLAVAATVMMINVWPASSSLWTTVPTGGRSLVFSMVGC